MAVSRSSNSDWMMHPSFVFKTFEESLIKSPFSYGNTPHIIPEKILESFVDQNGIRCYRVKWLDSWLTEQHVTAAFPHLITEYWINKPINDNADYQSYSNQGRTTLSSLPLTMPASLSITKTTHIETKSQTSTTSLHLLSPQQSTSIMSIPQLFSSDSSKQPQPTPSANLLSTKASTETDFIVGESLKLPEKINVKTDLSTLREKKTEIDEKNLLEEPKVTDSSIILYLDKNNSLYEVESPSRKKDISMFANKQQLTQTAHGVSFDNQVHQFVNQAAMQIPQLAHLNVQQDNDNDARKHFLPKTVVAKQKQQSQKQQQQKQSQKQQQHPTVTKKDKQSVVCDICGKLISSRKNLRVHKTVKHFKNGNFACDVCGRKFALNRDLKRHMPLHTNERKYVCPYCGLQCKQPGHLTKHIRTHTEVMNWRCDCCFKNFKVQADLKEHCFSEHADIKDKNLTCSVCKEKLKLPNSVYLHSLRHSGVREFECDICKATFKLKQHMQVHLKTHEKPKDLGKISCEICEKQFKFRHMYERHFAKHIEKTAEEYQKNQGLKEEEKRNKLEKKRIADVRKRQRASKSGCDDQDLDVIKGRDLPKRKRRKPSRVLYNEQLKTKLLVKQKVNSRRDHVCSYCLDTFGSKMLLNSHMKSHELDIPPEIQSNAAAESNVAMSISEENPTGEHLVLESGDPNTGIFKITSKYSINETGANINCNVKNNVVSDSSEVGSNNLLLNHNSPCATEAGVSTVKIDDIERTALTTRTGMSLPQTSNTILLAADQSFATDKEDFVRGNVMPLADAKVSLSVAHAFNLPTADSLVPGTSVTLPVNDNAIV